MTAIVEIAPRGELSLTEEQVDLIKRTICKGATDDELRLFLQQCRRTGLDPFARQIHAIRRYSHKEGREIMTVQVGIDGYRLIAERTDRLDGQDGPEWCGPDGVWKDVWLSADPPAAARVLVWRKGCSRPFKGIAHWDEYVQQYKDKTTKQWKVTSFWEDMPASQIAKCFAPDTEVLTEHGFQRFDAVNCRVLQVVTTGLEPVHAIPFRQPYAGMMVCVHGNMLNFAVTPNHDMVTTFGKVEAGVMYQTSRQRPVWRIPLRLETSRSDCDISDEDLELCGYVLADGWHNGAGSFNVSVSRTRKVEALGRLRPASKRVVQTNGKEADAGVRVIRSNFDKLVHVFPVSRCHWLFDTEKRVHHGALLDLSMRQAKIVLDAWQRFDGHTNRKTGVRRIYTSRLDHLRAIEVLAILAGYTVNTPRSRISDISDRPNYWLTISSAPPAPVTLPVDDRPGVVLEPNAAGEVWCVTVPSGVIVVRRHGFAMPCGNCAEALALRKAFPQELAGLYIAEELRDREEPRRPALAASRTSNGRQEALPAPTAPAPAEQSLTVYDRACNFERSLVERGLCETTELTAHLKATLGKRWPGLLQSWPAEAEADVRLACKAFHETCKSRNIQAEARAKSKVTVQQLDALEAELERAGEDWSRVVAKLRLPPGSSGSDLSQDQWEEAMDILGEMPNVEEAGVA